MEENKYAVLREAVNNLELVDSHAHSIVSLDSTFPFLRCFSEAQGDEASSYAPHTLSFKRSLRDVSELYGSENSLEAVEKYRKSSGMHSIASKCFQASKISALLIDDGIEFDNMFDIEWHKSFVPFVGRVITIEHLAQNILNQVKQNGAEWTVDAFTETFVNILKSYPLGVHC